MTIDSADLRYVAAPAAAAASRRAAATPAPSEVAPAGGAPPTDTVELSIPAAPPSDVLEQVTAAARCAEELARNNRELHFRADEHSCRIIIEVRDMSGNVLRTIPPSKALELIAAAAGRENEWVA
jgi:hypothetical protein